MGWEETGSSGSQWTNEEREMEMEMEMGIVVQAERADENTE